MSQSGYICFYTLEPVPDDKVVRLARDLFGGESVAEALRILPEPVEPGGIVYEDEGVIFYTPARRSEALSVSGMSLKQVLSLRNPGEGLWIQPSHEQTQALQQRIDAAIREAIPESIRGGFVPSGPELGVGRATIFRYSPENPDGDELTVPFLLSLFGWSTPNDWAGFADQVFQVPAVAEVERRIHEHVGPVERCMYWSF